MAMNGSPVEGLRREKVMKKFLLLMLCVTMLAGCTKVREPEAEESPSQLPEEERFPFTAENYPRVDGSTATIPLIGAVESALLQKPRAEGSVNVTKTSGAYVALANDEADILLVYDGGEETRKQVNADKLFETVPIGKDALVFLVNRDNPVENVTTEQVQKIFSGEYTSWNQLGGIDEPIRAYQRGLGSGSQALMDKLVMKDLSMAEPAKVQVIAEMGGLVDAVANFVGGPTGIGYNVFYYVTEMRKNENIKLLSIDGVEPSYETIQSGDYPFVSEFYSVIRKSEPEDSPARALHEWMLSDAAQNLMVHENYVALHANPKVSTPHVDGDYSMYPAGEEPIFFEATNSYSLEASDTYGALYFYLGAVRTEREVAPRFYGLCTGEGKIVTEPIYTVPTLLTDSRGNTAYLCFRADREREVKTVEESWGSYEQIAAPAILFATDGSWVQDYDDVRFCYGFMGAGDVAINADYIAVKKDGKWGAVDMNGKTAIHFDRDGPDGIYGQQEGDYTRLAITADRYLSNGRLYDAKGRLIAEGVEGMPIPKAGDFFATVDYDGEEVLYTYTLEGERLARLEVEGKPYGFSSFGGYVQRYEEDKLKIYDRRLEELSEIPLRFDEEYNHYAHLQSGEGVLYDSDRSTKLHRTYLPNGTRLVTWYDPDMWEDFSRDQAW